MTKTNPAKRLARRIQREDEIPYTLALREAHRLLADPAAMLARDTERRAAETDAASRSGQAGSVRERTGRW